MWKRVEEPSTGVYIGRVAIGLGSGPNMLVKWAYIATFPFTGVLTSI